MIAIVVAVVLWLLMRMKRSVRADDDSVARKAPPAATEPAAMIACAHCGVHLPREDALVGPEERRYCSEAHRALGPR